MDEQNLRTKTETKPPNLLRNQRKILVMLQLDQEGHAKIVYLTFWFWEVFKRENGEKEDFQRQNPKNFSGEILAV